MKKNSRTKIIGSINSLGLDQQKIVDTKRQVYFQTATLVNSAFALTAALAWNEAIKMLIERYVPTGSALYSKFIYASFLTFLVVIISMKLNKIIETNKASESDSK